MMIVPRCFTKVFLFLKTAFVYFRSDTQIKSDPFTHENAAPIQSSYGKARADSSPPAVVSLSRTCPRTLSARPLCEQTSV